MSEDIRGRIKEIRVKTGLSMKKFAELIGVTDGNISAWESGRALPGAIALKSIHEKLGYSVDWILTGEPISKNLLTEKRKDTEWMEFAASENTRKMLTSLIKRLGDNDLIFLADLTTRLFKHYNIQESVRAPGKEEEVILAQISDPDRQAEAFKETQDVYYMPVISQIAAGQPLGPEDFIEGYLPLPVNLVKNKTFLTRVRGDSMIGDGIRDGDIVQIRLQPVVEHGEIAAVRINGEVTLKYFLRKNNTIVLRSSNPDYQDIIVKSGDDVDIIGKYINNFPKEETEPLIDRFRSI